MSNFSQWSTTAASNNSASPDGAPEGMAPSGVNDSMREIMAAGAKWYKDTNGTIVTAGSSNAYTLTTNNVHAALTDQSTITFRADRANTGPATLNVDSLGAKSIKLNGMDLPTGALVADSLYTVVYNATNTTYDIQTPIVGLTKFFTGLEMSNGTDADHDIDVSAGACEGSDGTSIIRLGAITKQIDATWAAGSAAGGRSSSVSLSNATWYHVFAVLVGGAPDVLFDTSLTCANGVSDHTVTKYRYMGSVQTDGSANIKKFLNFGNKFMWDAPVRDVNSTDPGTSAVTFTATVPTGIKVEADVTVAIEDAGTAFGTLVLQNPSHTDAAPSTLSFDMSFGASGTATDAVSSTNLRVTTNTSAQLRYRADVSPDTIYVSTRGWKIDRSQI